MAFYILVYDVAQSRVAKVLKIVRKYLTWVQNSVAEGELTKSQLFELKAELDKSLVKAEDSVILYEFKFEVPKKTVLGRSKGSTDIII